MRQSVCGNINRSPNRRRAMRLRCRSGRYEETRMNTRELAATMATLFGELVDGPPEAAAYMLNRGDAGLLRSLDKLTARDASASVPGGGSIAAHADHLRYGLSLMNRWSAGENPFDDADWSVSWRIT